MNFIQLTISVLKWANLIILSYSIFYAFKIAIGQGIVTTARFTLADGITLWLSLQVGITLLSMLAFDTWEQIGICTALLAMRTLIKKQL